MNIKKIIREEMDDFDWIRDIDPNQYTNFQNVVIGKTYKIETDELLLNALEACDNDTYIYHYSTDKVVAISIDYNMKYNEIFCGSENDEKITSLKLRFNLGDGEWDEFWVTDDMVTLYEIYDNLDESDTVYPMPKKNSEKTEEEILTEKCWAGYTQKGMKTMFGKKYPNCVKKTK